MTTQVYSFFGPPGCGKGTVAERLVSDLGFDSLSTGNLCRQHIQDQTKLGKELKTYLDAGKLVPDELVNSMVVQWLKDRIGKKSNIILDGYPRTKGQADAFQKILKEDKAFADITFKVVNFDVPKDEIVRRLSSRVMCSNKKCQAVYSLIAKKPQKDGVCDLCGAPLIRRKDDEEQVIEERLKVFAEFAKDLLGFYGKTDTKVLSFVPHGGPNEAFKDFKLAIGK